MMIMLAAGLILVLAIIFSMLGLGGSMLYVPVFHWLGYDFKSVAIPTGLLLNGITVVSAAIVYLRSGMVDIKGSIPLVISSLVAAPMGAYLTRFLPVNTLILLFALGMAFAGGRMLLASAKPDKDVMMPPARRIPIMAAGGFGIGLIAGMLGIGGGFLFVPMMLAMGYPTKKAAATSSFVVIFSSFSGFAGHVAEGHFNWPLMLATASAVIIGALCGATLMKEKMKAKWIKQMFAVLLLGVAVKLLLTLYL